MVTRTTYSCTAEITDTALRKMSAKMQRSSEAAIKLLEIAVRVMAQRSRAQECNVTVVEIGMLENHML